MARLFSIKPAVTFRGRSFLGVRGWSGKPTPTGWFQQTPANPKLLCFQTGLYGLAIDVESLRLVNFGAIATPLRSGPRRSDTLFRNSRTRKKQPVLMGPDLSTALIS